MLADPSTRWHTRTRGKTDGGERRRTSGVGVIIPRLAVRVPPSLPAWNTKPCSHLRGFVLAYWRASKKPSDSRFDSNRGRNRPARRRSPRGHSYGGYRGGFGPFPRKSLGKGPLSDARLAL
jgi:hypothetical protein